MRSAGEWVAEKAERVHQNKSGKGKRHPASGSRTASSPGASYRSASSARSLRRALRRDLAARALRRDGSVRALAPRRRSRR
jgi:hypothetical protein